MAGHPVSRSNVGACARKSMTYHVNNCLARHELKDAITANQKEWVGWREISNGKLWLSAHPNCLRSCKTFQL